MSNRLTRIPEVINNFNVYKKGEVLVGISGEISLPDMEAMTTTISGAGVLGEYETSIIGQYGSMKMEIPFRMLDEDIFSIMNPTENIDLTLRASQQYTERATAELGYMGMRVIVRGKMISFKPGKILKGSQMDASVSIEVVYLMIEVDGEKKLVLDKLNTDYTVNNVDVLEKVRNQC